MSVRGGLPVWLALGPGYTEWNIDAAVDSQETIDWLVDRIVGQDGIWDGECGPADPPNQINSNDPDGDGIPTPCDNCPFVHNPEQLVSDDDFDGDGVGAACDFCPNLKSADQTANCNFDIEFEELYPGATGALPVLRLADFPNQAAFNAARDGTLAKIRPNACDPVPCPAAKLGVGGSLPSAELPTLDPALQPLCIAFGCTWTYKNRISIEPLTSPTILQGNPSTTTATTGLRWCRCESGTCKSDPTWQCVMAPAAYSNSSKWKPISTQKSAGWAAGKDIGKEWAIPLTSPSSTQPVVWDFLDLGAPAVHQDLGLAWVRGVLWSHFVSLANTYPGLDTTWVPKYGNIYFDGWGQVQQTLSYEPAFISHADKYVCEHCPEGDLDVFSQIGNPGIWVAGTDGPAPLATGPELEAFYQDVASGAMIHVPAAEPAGRLWQSTSRSMQMLKGVGFDRVAGVTRLLEAQGEGHEAPSIPVEVDLSAPTLSGNEALVLSGTLRRLFVVGGTVDGRDDGIPNASAWMLDVAGETWKELPIPTAERPGAVLAATYLIEDRTIYFLERVRGTLLLKRWEPLRKFPEGGAVRTIASLPSSWDGFAKTWLVAGSEGDLLFAGAEHTDPAKKMLVGRFTFDAERRLAFTGEAVDTIAALSRPSLRASRIGYSTQGTSGPIHKAIAVASLRVEAQAPVIY